MFPCLGYCSKLQLKNRPEIFIKIQHNFTDGHGLKAIAPSELVSQNVFLLSVDVTPNGFILLLSEDIILFSILHDDDDVRDILLDFSYLYVYITVQNSIDT